MLSKEAKTVLIQPLLLLLLLLLLLFAVLRVNYDLVMADSDMSYSLRVASHHWKHLGLTDGLSAADVYEETQLCEEDLNMPLEGGNGTLPPTPSFSRRRSLRDKKAAQILGPLDDIKQKSISTT